MYVYPYTRDWCSLCQSSHCPYNYFHPEGEEDE